MFPIFRLDKLSATQSRVSVVGTGFFVSSNGNFISVAHVFDNRIPDTQFLFFGYLPNKLQDPPLVIEEISRDEQNDIFVGRVKIKSPEHLNLSKGLPNIGKTICIAGYPLATISNNPQGGLELGGVRRYFQPSFVLDYMSLASNNGQGIIRNHDGFLVRDIGLFGMSGGPVFDTNGTVFGIQGSVTNPRVSTNGSRSIFVENALAIRSSLVLALLKDKRIRTN
ncbi:MAG: serine protease [Patescibacteria group bacterium]